MPLDALSDEVLRQWDVNSSVIVPPMYVVIICMCGGKEVYIAEDAGQMDLIVHEGESLLLGNSLKVILQTSTGFKRITLAKRQIFSIFS